MATSLPTLCYRQGEEEIMLATRVLINGTGEKPKKEVNSTVGIQMKLCFGNRWHFLKVLSDGGD